MNECLISMIMSWTAEAQIYKSSSVNDDTLFQQYSEKKAMKFD